MDTMNNSIYWIQPAKNSLFICLCALNCRDSFDDEGRFAALQDHWIREAQAFVLVYSVQSERTFKHAVDLHKKISRNKEAEGKRINLILVGNKSDLPMSEHEVSFDMGKQLADSWNVSFMETSAKTGDNVFDAFELLIKKTTEKSGDEEEKLMYSQKSSCGCTIL